MQEIFLKIRYFGRGLSKSLKNLTLFFLSNSISLSEQRYQKQKSPYKKITSANLCKLIHDINIPLLLVSLSLDSVVRKGKNEKNWIIARTERAF